VGYWWLFLRLSFIFISYSIYLVIDKLGRKGWPSIGKEEIYFFSYSDTISRGLSVLGFRLISEFFIKGIYKGGVVVDICSVVMQTTSELVGCFLNVFIF